MKRHSLLVFFLMSFSITLGLKRMYLLSPSQLEEELGQTDSEDLPC